MIAGPRRRRSLCRSERIELPRSKVFSLSVNTNTGDDHVERRPIGEAGSLGVCRARCVYLLVGWFAIRASIRGSRPSDSHSALSSLADGAGGRAALAVIALGLLSYGIWRILEAAFDKAGADGWRNVKRAGHGVSGFAHLLAVFAGSLTLQGRAASGGRGNSQDASARDWSGWALKTQQASRIAPAKAA